MKLILFTLFIALKFNVLLQVAPSGTGYILNRPSSTDCSLLSTNTVKIGNGTKRIEVCLEINNLVTTCGGGNNKSDSVRIYEDQNNNGVPETLLGVWAPTSALGCIMSSTSGNGYLYLLYCPADTCDLTDKSSSKITIGWNSYPKQSNDVLLTPLLIDNCVSSFTSNNYDAGNSTNCVGYNGNSGPPTNTVISFYNDLDCNNSSSGASVPYNNNGGDVSYSIENDIWYKFNPTITGTWVISITPSKCYPPNGGVKTPLFVFQYALFKGSTNNLNTVLMYGKGKNWITKYLSVVVSSTTDKYFLGLDGVRGTGCGFSITITPPGIVCGLSLPIELLSFTGKVGSNANLIEWVTASELNNDYFTLEKTNNGEDFEVVSIINGAGTSQQTINYHLEEYKPWDITYYRLKQTDFDGKYEFTDLVGVYRNSEINEVKILKVINILGQEVDENYSGPKIYYHSDGSYVKKM